MSNFFDSPFDLDGDGKLDIFERAIQLQVLDDILNFGNDDCSKGKDSPEDEDQDQDTD